METSYAFYLEEYTRMIALIGASCRLLKLDTSSQIIIQAQNVLRGFGLTHLETDIREIMNIASMIRNEQVMKLASIDIVDATAKLTALKNVLGETYELHRRNFELSEKPTDEEPKTKPVWPIFKKLEKMMHDYCRTSGRRPETSFSRMALLVLSDFKISQNNFRALHGAAMQIYNKRNDTIVSEQTLKTIEGRFKALKAVLNPSIIDLVVKSRRKIPEEYDKSAWQK